MLEYIKGVVADCDDGYAVIECNGIGYAVSVSATTLSALTPNKEIKLYTKMMVREDAISLIGFLTKEDMEMYTLLTGVSGVGAKGALAIQTTLDASQIILAVLSGDANAFVRAPGVGKKTAERILLELKDKFKSYSLGVPTADNPQETLSASTSAKNDAIEALCALGYNRSEAVRAVMEVTLDGMEAEQIIRLALKKLAG